MRSWAVQIRLLLLVLGLLSVFAYQNCSIHDPTSSSSSSGNLGNQLSGNGQGYEGKIVGNYYQFTPGFTCDSHPGPVGLLSISDSGEISYSSSMGNSCLSNLVSVNPSSVITSPFQSDFLVFNDFIFSRFIVKPEGIPDRQAEVLCRDSFPLPQIELVSHYDRTKGIAEVKFYGPLLKSMTQNIYYPKRTYSVVGLGFIDPSFSLTIDFQNQIGDSARFPGSLVTPDGQKNLECVLGGDISSLFLP